MITILFIFYNCLVRITYTTTIYDVNDLENIRENPFSDFLENFDENYAELNKEYELKFKQSLLECGSSILFNNNTAEVENKLFALKNLKYFCSTTNPYFDKVLTYGGKLFSYDQNIIGLITNSEQSIRLYYFNPYHKSLIQIYKKIFHQQVPFDACVDKAKNIYLVFPDEQKIGKYTLESFNHNGKFKVIKMNVVLEIKESDYNPSAISCYEDNIYVSERASNIIKVYDNNLNFLRNIEINGVVISLHRAIDINQNIRIFADDSSGIAFFNQIQHSGDSISNACHFYYDKNCVEDISTIVENKNKTLIYVADSCNKEVKQFIHYNNGNIALINSYIGDEIPTSILADSYGNL